MPTDPPNREPASASLQGSLSGCSGGAGGVNGGDDIREGGGGSDAGGGVPSLSLQSRLIDLPTTLPFKMTFKKKMSLSRCREVETSQVPNFQSEKKKRSSSQATGCPTFYKITCFCLCVIYFLDEPSTVINPSYGFCISPWTPKTDFAMFWGYGSETES